MSKGMNWTEEQLLDYQQRTKGATATPRTTPVTREEKAACVAPLPVAKGELPAFKGNKTEAAYGSLLEARKRAGEVLWYQFEGITLKLADDTRYTPDYAVLMADGTIQCHEVKGFWRDDARVKIKVAAAMFPFRFVAVQKEKGGGWKQEEF